MPAFFRSCGQLCGGLAVAVLLITVCALPWLLGGMIPLARLVLLSGATLAAELSLLAALLRGRLSSSVPAVMLPLVLLAVLGGVQLRSATVSPAARMQSAVNSPVLAEDGPQATHTLSPADTRTTIGTLVALALLAGVAFEQFRSPAVMLCSGVLLLANGIAITAVGMSHRFQETKFELNSLWTIGDPRNWGAVFATFINPNNAAGWLCLCLAVAAGWLTWQLKPAATTPSLRRGRLRISLFGRIWQRSMEFMADLTVGQILAFSSVALLGAGVAATQSRGGILAMLVAAVLTASLKSSLRHLPVTLLLLAVCGAATFGVLQWLSLDADIVGEMESLRDLDQASGIRPAHWADAVHVVLDFPLLGTGLGAYRFATLPYQTFDAGVWFRNADNHYVDLLIEGGLAGLLLFAAIGVCGVLTGRAAWQQSKTRTIRRRSEAPRVSRRILAGLGTAAVMGTLTQAVSGVFDYGVGMPAAASLLVLLIAATAGVLAQTDVPPGLQTAGSIRMGRPMIIVGSLSLITIGMLLIPEQRAAWAVDAVAVTGHRLLQRPVSVVELEQIPETRMQLDLQLQRRPDDAEAVRLAARLADAEFRWEFLKAASDLIVTDDSQASTQFERFTVSGILDRVWQQQHQRPMAAIAARQQLRELLQQTRLPDALQQVQQQWPLAPGIAMQRALVAALLQDAQTFQQQVEASRFAAPADAENLSVLGSAALRLGQPELATALWQDSLAVTDRYRSAILADAALYFSGEDTLRLFGPTDYGACVRAAESTQDREQRQYLYERAEEFWTRISQPVDVPTSLLRASHLERTQRPDAALEWLKTSLADHPEDVSVRSRYAAGLEKAGHYRDALDQWHHILYLDPQNATAQSAVTRIRGMK